MKFLYKSLFFIFLSITGLCHAQNNIIHLRVITPEYSVGENFIEIKLEALNSKGRRDSAISGKHEILFNEHSQILDFINGVAFSTIEVRKTQSFIVQNKLHEKLASFTIRYLPPWLSILPAVLAILLALITKEVIISLFLSIFLGVLTLKGFEFSNIIPSLFTVVDRYILETLNDTRHLSVIIFSFLIGGMVTVISHNGGMRGVVNLLSRFSHSPRSAQLMTFFLGFGIFYDNYANSLIVGNTMKPVTDKYKVSREKLAFIVHCTAASIAAIAFVTTWIGAELVYVNDATANLGISEKAYSLFLQSLRFTFYPILMLFFIFFLILLRKDFGPMNLAEIESRSAGVIKENLEKEKKENEDIEQDIRMLEPEPVKKDRWLNAFIPIAIFIVVAFAGLLITGAKNAYENLLNYLPTFTNDSFGEIWKNLPLLHKNHHDGFFAKLGVLMSYSDFYIPLLWSSFSGITVAVLISILQKGVKVRETMENLLQGLRLILSAVIILVLAWALADVIQDLHTTDYIASVISSKFISPKLLPAIIFILAALFSFATGSVWGTMAIIYPLIIPVTWSISLNDGLSIPEAEYILYTVIGSVMAGTICGNQCSPISETTIVSSISCDCDHVAHVRTQVPYALVVASVALGLILLSIFKLHWAVNYLIGIIVLLLIIKYRGKRIE